MDKNLLYHHLFIYETDNAHFTSALIYTKNETFDLLLLDMILGEGMDGLDTFREILAINPGQRAIITSGFSETDRIAETIRLGAGQYVKKPYMMYKIGIAIKQELQRKINT